MSEVESDSAVGLDLCEPSRLWALAKSGLTAEPDPQMDYLAEWVCRLLDVPVALVSLVQADQQVFPGMQGLPEPWASKRATPLSHSFCQYVVGSAEPMVIEDTRESVLEGARLAISELGVVAYAGVPLTDDQGRVLGSLCAIDRVPRNWTVEQLSGLRDLATACTAELRLRLARYDAEREREHRDELEAAQRRSYQRSQSLLAASQAFASTITVADVRVQVAELLASQLETCYVGLVLLDERRQMQRMPDPHFGPGPEDTHPWTGYPISAAMPTAQAVREGRLVHHPDRASLEEVCSAAAGRLMHDMGMQACTAVPLPGPEGPLGALLLGWPTTRELDATDRTMITTVAGFAAHALTRAQYLEHRVTVAHGMQEAMLTTLPEVAGLRMSATYRPADAREHIGGDWYDAVAVPDVERPEQQVVVVSVGDVIGHEMRAATLMGQARSMLRQAAWDHPAGPPSRIFDAFEQANNGLEIDVAGTAVLAQLRRGPTGGWTLSWTNAGHPPPVLVHADGSAELLEEHGMLFGLGITPARPRTDHHRVIEAGSMLVLYTDGLIERRGHDLDEGTADVLATIDRSRGSDPAQLVHAIVDEVAPDGRDDIVVFAISFPT